MPGGTPEVHGSSWLLGGPVGWFLVILLVAAAVGSLYVVVDSLRPARRHRLETLPEPWWLYLAVEGLYFIALAVSQTGLLPPIVGGVAAITTPVALGFLAAYLLRVVFPKPAAASLIESAEAPTEKAQRLP